jgi:hypothetical protein
MDETMDSRAQDIVVHADGMVFRGGVPIVSPTVGVNTVSWSMANGNGTDGNITFLDGSANTNIWGPGGRTGVLFEGLGGPAEHGIRFPGEGWLDFRGVRTCVPTATCEARCGPMFDGCATVDCGGCPAGQYCAGGTVGPNVCTDGTAPYMVGTYTTGTKWGGWSGTWNPGSDLRITPAGEIFKGGIRIANPTMVGGKTPGLYHSWTASCASCHGPGYPRPSVSWTIAGGNDSNAAVTFTEGSANEYYWPGGQGGWLYEGWIQYPGEGAVDYRGLKQ